MNNVSIIKDIFSVSWSDFKKHVGFLFILAIVHSLIFSKLLSALQVGNNFSDFAMNVVGSSAFFTIKSLLSAIVITSIMQYVLDIVYNRPLKWFFMKETTLQAILVNFILCYNSSREVPKNMSIFNFDFIVETIQDLAANQYIVPALLVLLFVVLPIALAFVFRFMFLDLFILEDECSIFEAFNRSWNLSLGNFSIYLASLILPLVLYFSTVVITLLERFMDINIVLILLYGFMTSLILLFNVHLFKKLREIEMTEE